ncbi:hypothetical protein MPSEU_000321100 [Mayamaea pseudoterrestris]|nr:hypothetical protein MPSEU_000321100 [Mayamaea pseudoterrestris]
MAESAAAHVLYIDWVGHPAPLSHCYYATASRRLSSSVDRYPLSTFTEPESAYCPNCLTPQDKAALGRSPYCPKTTCQRCPLCNHSALVNAVVNDFETSETNGLCVYKCGRCHWSSQQCHLQVPVQIEDVGKEGDVINVDRLELARSAEDLFLDLKKRRQSASKPLEAYFESLKKYHEQNVDWQQLTNKARMEPWSLAALESSLQETKNKLSAIQHESRHADIGMRRLSLTDDNPVGPDEHLTNALPKYCFQLQSINSCQLPLRISALLPLPTPLRVRLGRRCRAELKEGKPGILLKPKLDPLDGDSSQRTGVGQWMKKDASAIHVIPCVRVVKCCSLAAGAVSLLLTVDNPNLESLRFRFVSSDYQGEPAWENSEQTSKSMEHLLLHSMASTGVDAELDVDVLKDMKPSTTVELLSGEDSIIELGVSGSKVPIEVKNWQPRQGDDGGGSVTLIAQSASVAWFELTLTGMSEASSTGVAIPLALEIELGNGSWETSMIPRRLDLAEGAVDTFRLDLLIVLDRL